ncbi:MAG TPA: TetR/AcrR family transcriptional regulator [Anaerolineae bacterium]
MTLKVDRRIQRTRQLLKDAMMELILEKGYDAVTVQDITDRANLGRATFYLHYRDKDELLVKSLEAVFEDLVQQMPALATGQWPLSDAGPIAVAFRHITENADLYRIILSRQGGTTIPRRIRSYIAGYVQVFIEAHLAQTAAEPLVPVDVLANYIAGSLLALVTWWLESETPHPAEEMVVYYHQLVVLGAAQVMGINIAQLRT